MSIQPLTGVLSGLSQAGGVGGLASVTGPGAAGAANPTSGVDFAAAIDNLQALQSTSDALAVKAVTGDLDDIHDYTIASSQASVALELTAAIRNKAVDAFTEIMRMQA